MCSSIKESRFPRELPPHCSNTVHPWTYAPAFGSRVIASLIALLLAGALSFPLNAADLVVNTTADNLIAADNFCTLREAIINSNSDVDNTSADCLTGSGADTITLPGGVYILTLVGAKENLGATGDLDINDDLTINGTSSSNTIVDGNFTDRVFEIISSTVVINDLVIRNGRTPDGTPGAGCSESPCSENATSGEPGGGIRNTGDLELNRVVVRSNRTGDGGVAGDVNCPGESPDCSTNGGFGGSGGGIENQGMTLALYESHIMHNETGNGGAAGTVTCGVGGSCSAKAGEKGDGGGIFRGSMDVTLSNFTDNKAKRGGAIYSGPTPITITASSFSGNSAEDRGGALDCDNNNLPCTVSASTFFGNSAGSSSPSGNGGAISFAGIGTKSITNTTISGNKANGFGGGINVLSGTVVLRGVTLVNNQSKPFGGGGVSSILGQSGTSVQIANTIIANNHDPTGVTTDCGGNLTTLGYNLLESTSGCSFVKDPVTDQTNLDPLLGPLAYNGGPTRTHALRQGSPALDTGSAAGTNSVDQRGLFRPYITPAELLAPAESPSGAVVNADKGAVEMHGLLVTNNLDAGSGSLRAAFTASDSNGVGQEDILFDEAFFSSTRTINLQSALPVMRTSFNLIGPGADRLKIHRQSVDPLRIIQNHSANTGISIRDVTISNGKTNGGFGGGIFAVSDLTLENVAVIDSETAYSGGAVSLSGANGLFINSSFVANTAPGGGGAISFEGYDKKTLRLVSSTFSGNTAGNYFGGAIYFSPNSGVSTLGVFNSTISDNSADSYGAIWMFSQGSNSTGITILHGTIFSNNSAPQLAETVIPGSFADIHSNGFNLSTDDAGGFLDNASDQINIDAKLGPLSLNGGTTPSHLPAPDSPGIDQGSCYYSNVYFDQRGLSRPFDVPTISNLDDGCDIGSLEWWDADGDGVEDSDVAFRDGFES
jgi:CSLREA domain-containing protein